MYHNNVSQKVHFPLTICSVSFNSRSFLEKNYDLMRKLNPSSEKLRWIVAENSQPYSEGSFSSSDKFEIQQGFSLENISQEPRSSFHHALALQKILAEVKTRYVLLMDPDFYIVKKEWIKTVLQYMDGKKLAFFGAPWSPKWYMKIRYFPACLHCLFVDLSLVNISELNLLPREKTISMSEALSFREKSGGVTSFAGPLWRLYDCLRMSLWGRRCIGKCFDSGCALVDFFQMNPGLKIESFVPAFSEDDAVLPTWLYSIPFRLLERFLPDRYCYLPKKKSSFKTEGSFGFCQNNLKQMVWEEFFWQEKAFGFHIRSYYRSKNLEQIQLNLEKVLFKLL